MQGARRNGQTRDKDWTVLDRWNKDDQYREVQSQRHGRTIEWVKCLDYVSKIDISYTPSALQWFQLLWRTKKNTTNVEGNGNGSRSFCNRIVEPRVHSNWSSWKIERHARPESQGTLDMAEQKLVQLFQRDRRIILIICNVLVKTFFMVGFILEWSTPIERMAKGTLGRTGLMETRTKYGVDEAPGARWADRCHEWSFWPSC